MIIQKTVIIILLFYTFSAIPGSAAEIHVMAEQGNLQGVIAFIEKNPETINEVDEGGYTPLHKAAYNNHVDIAEYLISKGAEINARSGSGSTPLHGAAFGGHLEAARFLLENGADLTIKNGSGFTPFLSACAGGRTATTKLLASHGADIHTVNNFDWTALIYAANSDSLELIEFLIEKGCDVNAATPDGISPLSRALWNASKTAVELLINNGADVDAVTADSLTQLYFAVAYRDKEISDLMIDRGTNFNMKNNYGLTMLHYAAARGFPDQVEKIIKKGVDINAKCINGKTALYYASIWGHNAVVNYLREKGAEAIESKITPLKGDYFGQKKPDRRPGVFAENLLLTPFAPHGSIVFSPDGSEVFWCHHAMPIQAMWRMKQKDGVWSLPQIAAFTDPATEYHDGSPCFTEDGTRIYYHSHRPIDGTVERKEDSDIWYVDKTPDGWGLPKNVGSPLNSENSEYAPSISKNGSIYFIGDGYDDSLGAGDIYVSEYKNGKYTTPKNLGPAVNSASHELNPIIAPDEGYLIFSSNRPHPVQGLNMYVSFKKSDGSWTEAVSLGQSINDGHAWHPFITPDGENIIYLKDDNYQWFSSKAIDDLKDAVLGTDPTPDKNIKFEKSTQNLESGDTRKVLLGDLDADGDLDAVFSSGQVWLNDGAGYFTLKQDNMAYRGHGAAIGDVDGDRDIDIIFASHPNNIYFNDGAANFTKSGHILGDSTIGSGDIVLQDFDADGDIDAFVKYMGLNCIYLNDGNGDFTFSDSALPGSSFHDLDGDGDIDYFVRERGVGYKVVINNGQGDYTDHWTLADSTVDYGFVNFADLDKDGDPDAVVTNGGNNDIFPTLLLFNDGTGRFEIKNDNLPRTRWGNTAFGDFNNDGFLDALVTSFTLPNCILLNNGKGLLHDAGFRFGGNAGNMISGIGDLDGDGDVDLFISNFEGGSNEIWFNEL